MPTTKSSIMNCLNFESGNRVIAGNRKGNRDGAFLN